MTRRTIRRFDLLLLTNCVDRTADRFQAILSQLRCGMNVPAVVIAKEPSAFKEHYLILDGNNRAVAAALLDQPLRVFELRGSQDIDQLLALESREGLAPFPHRRFLTGQDSFEDLKRAAIWNAGLPGFRTADTVADSFRLSFHSTEHTTPSLPIFIENDVDRWISLLKARFIRKDPYRIFTCSINELASVCVESPARALGIAKCLVEENILEIPADIDGGNLDIERNDRWRFKKN